MPHSTMHHTRITTNDVRTTDGNVELLDARDEADRNATRGESATTVATPARATADTSPNQCPSAALNTAQAEEKLYAT